jgi:hypothetical protein
MWPQDISTEMVDEFEQIGKAKLLNSAHVLGAIFKYLNIWLSPSFTSF